MVDCSRPAIIIDPPDGSSTIVSARRTDRPGTLTVLPTVEPLVAPPPRVRLPTLVISENSVEIFSEIRPRLSTTGVNPRPTP